MNRFQKITLCSQLPTIVFIALLLGTQIAEAATPLSCGAWSVVPAPGAGADRLFGLATISASNAWAVGLDFNLSGEDRTFIEHWNGKKWSIVPSPNASSGNNNLLGVAAVSPDDIWAVGDYLNSNSATLTLIEHWDGTKWSIVPSPNHDRYGQDFLLGVSAVSVDDVWATGEYIAGTGRSFHTLMEHWNGSKWSIVPSPGQRASDNTLYGMTALSKNDAWAVGAYSNTQSYVFTLVEHWNGKKWSIVSSPNPEPYDNRLYKVAAISANDIWAVGQYCHSLKGTCQVKTLTEHWNGKTWSVVASPIEGLLFNVLNGIEWNAASTNDVWAVGAWSSGNQGSGALIEHWDGKSWSIVANPAEKNGGDLFAVAQVPGTSHVWAVGDIQAYYPLAEFYC